MLKIVRALDPLILYSRAKKLFKRQPFNQPAQSSQSKTPRRYYEVSAKSARSEILMRSLVLLLMMMALLIMKTLCDRERMSVCHAIPLRKVPMRCVALPLPFQWLGWMDVSPTNQPSPALNPCQCRADSWNNSVTGSFFKNAWTSRVIISTL